MMLNHDINREEDVYRFYRIVSIDPGSNTAGFSVLEIDYDALTITVKDSMTIDKGLMLRMNPLERTVHSDRITKLFGYFNFLHDQCTRLQPQLVCCENAYLSRFAAAYGTLKEQIMLFRTAVYNYDRFAQFHVVEPSTAKMNMGVKGGSKDKEDMRRALKKRKDIFYGDGIDIDALDEHSIDSICIGLFFADKILCHLKASSTAST